MRTLTWTGGLASVAIMSLALLLIMVSPAPAQHAGYSSDTWSWSWGACEECRRRREIMRRQRARAQARHWAEQQERRRHKLYRERDDDDRGRHCQRDRLAVVGDQYASEQGAQQEADKAWMQTARWQYGERYMSREAAVDAHYECGRSSVGSVVGQVFYRCRLTARPCAPQKQRAN